MKEYPFIFTIPPNAPPSFKNRFGKLTLELVATTLKEKFLQRRYYATVALDRPTSNAATIALVRGDLKRSYTIHRNNS